MNILKKLFGPKQQPETVLQRAQELGGKLIVSGYRRVFCQGRVGASPEMSDALILQIYSRVGTAFREVAEARGDLLDAGTINMIVLYFLENYRTTTPEFFEEHLQYELDKYRRGGLRADYQRPLHLF